RLALLTSQPLIALALIWAAMLLYMLLVDWLNRRQIDTPARQIIILAAFAATSLLAIAGLLYPVAAWFSVRWMQGTLAALFNFTNGLRPELVILLLNFFLWFRVATFTDRGLSFFSV